MNAATRDTVDGLGSLPVALAQQPGRFPDLSAQFGALGPQVAHLGDVGFKV
jgi:hypothetical protein